MADSRLITKETFMHECKNIVLRTYTNLLCSDDNHTCHIINHSSWYELVMCGHGMHVSVSVSSYKCKLYWRYVGYDLVVKTAPMVLLTQQKGLTVGYCKKLLSGIISMLCKHLFKLRRHMDSEYISKEINSILDMLDEEFPSLNIWDNAKLYLGDAIDVIEWNFDVDEHSYAARALDAKVIDSDPGKHLVDVINRMTDDASKFFGNLDSLSQSDQCSDYIL